MMWFGIMLRVYNTVYTRTVNRVNGVIMYYFSKSSDDCRLRSNFVLGFEHSNKRLLQSDNFYVFN